MCRESLKNTASHLKRGFSGTVWLSFVAGVFFLWSGSVSGEELALTDLPNGTECASAQAQYEIYPSHVYLGVTKVNMDSEGRTCTGYIGSYPDMMNAEVYADLTETRTPDEVWGFVDYGGIASGWIPVRYERNDTFAHGVTPAGYESVLFRRISERCQGATDPVCCSLQGCPYGFWTPWAGSYAEWEIATGISCSEDEVAACGLIDQTYQRSCTVIRRLTDPGLNITCYQDNDHDGFGGEGYIATCECGPNSSARPGDCDDEDAQRNPDMIEVCDYKDNDCNGLIDDSAEPDQRQQRFCRDQDHDGLGDPNNCIFICLKDSNKPEYEDYVKTGNPEYTGGDNCPDIPNPREWAENPYSELIIMGATSSTNGFWSDNGNLEKGYYWQPDHDLDGIGDACDEYSADPLLAQHGYTTSSTWYKEKIFFVEKLKGVVQEIVLKGYKWDKKSIVRDSFNMIEVSHRIHFCGLDMKDYCETTPVNGKCPDGFTRWGRNGYCTTSIGNAQGDDVAFGYSHGGDPYPQNLDRQMWQHISWKNTIPEARALPFRNTIVELEQAGYRDPILLMQNNPLSTVVPQVFWNWRVDAWASLNCIDPSTAAERPLCQSGLKSAGGQPFYYTLSSNYVTEVPGQAYMVNEQINPEYFYNRDNQYARSTRLTHSPVEVRYTGIATGQLITDIGQRVRVDWANAAPAVIKAPDYSAETPYVIGTGVTSQGSFYAARKMLPQETVQIVQRDDRAIYAIHNTLSGGTTLSVNFGQSGDWHQLGLIENYAGFGLHGSTATIHDDTIYLAAVPYGPTYAPKLYRLLRNENDRNFHLEQVAIIPPSITNIKLISVAGKPVILTNNDLGTMDLWAFDPTNNEFFELAIPANQKPVARQIVNVHVSGDTLYIIGGQNLAGEQIKDMRRITLADPQNASWTTIPVDLTTADTAKLIMREVDGILMMYNIYVPEENPTTTAIEFNLGTEAQPTITSISNPDIGGIEYESVYCLSEEDSTVSGGTLIGANCTPFTHPWYKQYSIGTTVYSVAGKGNRLYVGTGNAIKVYDISDPNALVLKSTFSTSNRIVYDLEVADGDIMYAATSKGLYKLSTANPDTLTIIGSFYSTGSYNYQYRIQLYNGNLYVGDDNGINIRNKDTFARLSYVNIGSTMDFAIANGEIAMYWDDFWSSGIDIRNVDNLATRKAWDYPYCSTGELTTDHGAFYLSCDGYEYRFAGLANTYIDYTELNGDMREMQENHMYNGWVYIPDGSYVKLSTNNTVPSICGNGIIEPGEFCDGNTEDCAILDPNEWDSGTAYCNSTCTAWDTGDCYWSGC